MTSVRSRTLAALGFLLFAASRSAEAQLEIPRPEQYKRVHQEALVRIQSGEAREAIADMDAFLARNPGDAESHFMICAARCALGELDEAVAAMNRGLSAGLPPERFVGGSLAALAPLRERPEWKTLAASFDRLPVHGPTLGNWTGDSIDVWVRTAREADVFVEAWAAEDAAAGKLRSAVVRSRASDDFTAVATLRGLRPAKRYVYSVIVDGRIDPAPGPLPDETPLRRWRDPIWTMTTPATGADSPGIRIAVGGCAGYTPENERVWTTIARDRPDALVLLGDNVYIDAPENRDMQLYCYYRRQSRPEFRHLASSLPVYAIWDDHDFGTNDCSGGPDPDSPPWKREVLKVFRQNWPNPPYAGGDAVPGNFFDFRLGDVRFFMLDGRFWRDPDAAPPTMLGPAQKRWFLDALSSPSRAARFNVLCSPVPWTLFAKGDSADTWNGFREERREIFGALTANRVEGVVLLSADRHRTDFWRIERDGDYPLCELTSGRLTNLHVHAEVEEAEFSYNDKQSYGLVEFDARSPDRDVVFRVRSIDGEEVGVFREAIGG